MSRESDLLQINMDCPCRLAFSAKRRGQTARDEHRVPRFLSGFADFDMFVAVEGSPDDQLLKFFKSGTARQAVSDLLTMGYDEITLGHNRLSAKWHDYPTDVSPSRDLIELTHKQLRRITKLFEEKPIAPIVPAPQSIPRRRFSPLKWILLLSVLGGIVWYFRDTIMKRMLGSGKWTSADPLLQRAKSEGSDRRKSVAQRKNGAPVKSKKKSKK